MNVLKNFEALFVITLGLACAANYALDDAPQQQAKAVAMAVPANMQVVVVSAKRLSAEQKLQSLVDERKASLATADHASKM
jgi:prolyl-tRNA editing enzyme YbaK/EbsC (Cys-tRNA(Pro) deacylase)